MSSRPHRETKRPVVEARFSRLRKSPSTLLVLSVHAQTTLMDLVKVSSSILNGYKNQGDEFGGHFVPEQRGNRVVLRGVASQSLSVGHTPNLCRTTGVNVGDFPYTFHTHPTLYTVSPVTQQNVPDTISSGDLVAAVNDASWANGSSVCDILASPTGLQVYRARKPTNNEHFGFYEPWERQESLLKQKINGPQSWNTGTAFSSKVRFEYIKALADNGFDVVMRPWSCAMTPIVIDIASWKEVR